MLVQIEELTKVYRTGTRANDGISLAVAEGEVFGLLGHNGAGKTTLVNQVIGLLRPTSGSIRVDGRDLVADPGLARRLCSFQAQAHVPIDGLTPRQAIDLLGQLRGGSQGDVRRRRELLVDALDIGEWLDVDAASLSGGVKRLVAFAMAAVWPGRVVMLDEPTNDVDPLRRRLLWQQVRRLADDGAAVLLVTHNVIEAERSVDQAGDPRRRPGHRRGDPGRAQGPHRRRPSSRARPRSGRGGARRSRRSRDRPSAGRQSTDGGHSDRTAPARPWPGPNCSSGPAR